MIKVGIRCIRHRSENVYGVGTDFTEIRIGDESKACREVMQYARELAEQCCANYVSCLHRHVSAETFQVEQRGIV